VNRSLIFMCPFTTTSDVTAPAIAILADNDKNANQTIACGPLIMQLFFNDDLTERIPRRKGYQTRVDQSAATSGGVPSGPFHGTMERAYGNIKSMAQQLPV